ncbi:hypothetical protein BC835DRAFT_316122 [Cytidiella melzeri]|nr:hypothetical protein BC835DRAFT_316122 [Cytidiella melzeri]
MEGGNLDGRCCAALVLFLCWGSAAFSPAGVFQGVNNPCTCSGLSRCTLVVCEWLGWSEGVRRMGKRRSRSRSMVDLPVAELSVTFIGRIHGGQRKSASGLGEADHRAVVLYRRYL